MKKYFVKSMGTLKDHVFVWCPFRPEIIPIYSILSPCRQVSDLVHVDMLSDMTYFISCLLE